MTVLVELTEGDDGQLYCSLTAQGRITDLDRFLMDELRKQWMDPELLAVMCESMRKYRSR